MSNKTKLIIGLLFLVQIGIIGWSQYDSEVNKAPFKQRLDLYLENPESVTTLYFEGYGLTRLPDDILQFQNVETIDLSHNNFTKIPAILYELPNLKRLNMSYNQLKNIDLRKFESITDLDFSHNNIEDCSGQSYLDLLRNVDLSHNKISVFPAFRTAMDTVNLSHNNLNNFREVAYSIYEIQHLDLSFNSFYNFKDVRLLANSCYSLDLSNHHYAKDDEFPISLFSENFMLKKLFLNGCPFDSFDSLPASQLEVLDLGKSFIDIRNDALETQWLLKTLDLENAGLYNLNYTNANLIELNLVDVFVYGDIKLNLPNLEILHLSVTLDDIELPDLFNIETIHYHSVSDRFIERLRAKYPDANIIFHQRKER